jgi:hypothetical protein
MQKTKIAAGCHMGLRGRLLGALSYLLNRNVVYR